LSAQQSIETLKNRIEHVKGLIKDAPSEDKAKLREILKSHQQDLKKLESEEDDAEESVTVPRADLEKLLTECGKLRVPETAELKIENGMVTVTVSKDHAGKLRTALGL
jgi:ribosome recycling factor